jgi:hypothetical protein
VSRKVVPFEDGGEHVLDVVWLDVFNGKCSRLVEDFVEEDALKALNGIEAHVVRRISVASTSLEIRPTSAAPRRITLSADEALAPIAIRSLVNARYD